MNKYLIFSNLSFYLFLLTLIPFRVSAQPGGDLSAPERTADSLLTIAATLVREQKMEEALALTGEAIAGISGIVEKTNPIYIKALYRQTRIQVNLKKYREAQTGFETLLPLVELVSGKIHIDYYKALSDWGTLYMTVGKNNEAEQCYSECVSILEKLPDDKRIEIGQVSVNLGILYSGISQFEKAEYVFVRAKDIFEATGQTESVYYSYCLSSLGSIYSRMKQFKKAITYLTASNQQYINRNQHKNPGYAYGLHELGLVHYYLLEYEKALPFLLESKSIYLEVMGTGNAHYAGSISALGAVYLGMKQYAKADSLYREARTIYETTPTGCEPCYTSTLSNLAKIKMLSGEYEAAAQEFQFVLDYIEKSRGIENDDYLSSAVLMAQTRFRAGETEDAAQKLIQCSALEKRLLYRASGHFSQKEIAAYLPRISKTENWFGTLSQEPGILPENWNSAFYDAILFKKGHFLQISQMTGWQVAQGSETAAQNYAAWKSGQQQLIKVSAQSNSRQQLLDSLENQVLNLEKTLVQSLPGFAASRQDLQWQDIRAALQPNEAVVEFVRFNDMRSDPSEKVMYAALVLLPGAAVPQYVPLFEEKELLRLTGRSKSWLQDYTQNLYAQKQPAGVKNLYQLIWEPLEKHLRDVKTVYYAPAGLLHRLNIGAVEKPGGARAGQRKLVLMGSTRQVLPGAVQQKPGSDALVIGGVLYDDTPAQTGAPADMTSRNRGIDFSYDNADSTLRGNSWNYLPNTLTEAEKIATTLNKSGIKTEKHTGLAATEENFKKQCGGSQSPRIVHVATHGFFFPDAQNAVDTVAKVFRTNENPMMRSGLVLAGANHAWKTGKTAGVDQEDGILTAYEISLLNLSNTELVVLSACETGLGDIAGNEGVYGLQRAFKIAGARYLIMSLWKVPDEQTEQLMTLFYEKWLNGKKSIPDAFREAQSAMQAKNLNPFYWAGFVLLE